jgi:hypothetical protein
MVLKTMGVYKDVEFVETEFQPQTVPPAYPGMHASDNGGVEVELVSVLKTADGRVRLRKAPIPTGKIKASGSRDKKEINQRLIKAHSGITTTLTTVDEGVEEVEEEKDLEAQSFERRVTEKEIV